MSTICELRIAFEPPYLSKKDIEIRYEQYYNGLKKVLDFDFKSKKCDLYVLDNTLKNLEQIPKDILSILETNSVEIILSNQNAYGMHNKGAGDIENLKPFIDKIKLYEWFIHFEPRQLLVSFQFFENFFTAPRNLFTLNKNPNAPPHFNTGLYACRTNEIIKFISLFDENKLEEMVKNKISIEYILYNFFHRNNIQYDTLEKMDLLWYNDIGIRHY